MGVVGQWDPELFARYRAARGTDDEKRLLGELVRVHEPLIQRFARQWLHDPRAGGAHRLEFDDALSAVRLAFVRWLPVYNPARAPLASFLKLRVLGEIQRAIQETAVVMRGVRRRPPDIEYLGEADEQLEAENGSSTTGLFEAIEDFVERHLRFEADARLAASALVARYERTVVAPIGTSSASHGWRRRALDVARDQASPRGALMRALAGRGARPTTVRVPWEETPVRGFRGVRLQNDATRIMAAEA